VLVNLLDGAAAAALAISVEDEDAWNAVTTEALDEKNKTAAAAIIDVAEEDLMLNYLG
jgi:hypothetical protein